LDGIKPLGYSKLWQSKTEPNPYHKGTFGLFKIMAIQNRAYSVSQRSPWVIQNHGNPKQSLVRITKEPLGYSRLWQSKTEPTPYYKGTLGLFKIMAIQNRA
jgi:hypothetical protein